MTDLIHSRRNAKLPDLDRQSRNSCEAKHLGPLHEDEGTDESRYYRSAEFQQALREEESQRNLTSPVEAPAEASGRLSRNRYRRSMVTIKSSLTHSLGGLAYGQDHAMQAPKGPDAESPPPAYHTVVQSAYAGISDDNVDSEQQHESDRYPFNQNNSGQNPSVSSEPRNQFRTQE